MCAPLGGGKDGMNNRIAVRLAAIAALTALLGACASAGRKDNSLPNDGVRASSDVTGIYGSPPYTIDPGLVPQVAFWRQVFADWSLADVALHDDEYLGLVYTVIRTPGTVTDQYSPAQREYVRQRTVALENQLRNLERKARTGDPLSYAEQALASTITRAAGPGAIAGASERVRAQRGLRERFRRGVEISGRYDAIFRQIFREAGLPEDFAYLPHVESSFQAHARSSAGAAGIWQFTLPAARTYMNVHPSLDPRLDPVSAARGAANYLGHAYKVLGNWPLAVTSYNHGIRGMQNAKRRYGTDMGRIVREYDGKNFGFASRNFYAEFLAAREVASQPRRFFPEGIQYEPPQDWERIVLDRRTRASELASRYHVGMSQLIALNPAWTPAAWRGRVALPAGTEVWLPPGTLSRAEQSAGDAAQELAQAPPPSRLQRL